MTVNTSSETKYYIGGSTPIDYSSDANAIDDFEALTWVLIGEVEDGGEYGDEAADVTFQSLADGRVRHLKGARDAGVLALVFGDDPMDAGQIALKAAEQTKLDFNFKVEYADAPQEGWSGSVDYFRGKVQSVRKQVGAGDNVVRRTGNIGISTAILTVEPADLTP